LSTSATSDLEQLWTAASKNEELCLLQDPQEKIARLIVFLSEKSPVLAPQLVALQCVNKSMGRSTKQRLEEGQRSGIQVITYAALRRLIVGSRWKESCKNRNWKFLCETILGFKKVEQPNKSIQDMLKFGEERWLALHCLPGGITKSGVKEIINGYLQFMSFHGVTIDAEARAWKIVQALQVIGLKNMLSFKYHSCTSVDASACSSLTSPLSSVTRERIQLSLLSLHTLHLQ
jgi:hypothetical protein